MTNLPDPTQRALLALLTQLHEAVRQLKPAELQDVLDGVAKVRIVTHGTPTQDPRPSSKRVPLRATTPQVVETERHLRSAGSREDGIAHLSEYYPTKTSLEALARHLDLPVTKKDTAIELRDRIIDHTIGYRLRSEVIRRSRLDRG